MTVKFTNNASTTVATGINTSATSLTVASASPFPQLAGADDYCYLTIQQATGTGREVVKATALSTNTFTIARAQDGTTAGTWSAGDIVELRMTAALLTDVIDAATVEGVKSNFQYTPTAGQTVFSGADNSSNTLVINQSGLVNVYMNGVRLVQGTDYTASAANNTITLTTGATTSDIIDIEVYGNFTGQSGAAVAITGGAISGTSVAATTLSASGTATLNTFVSNNSTISGGTINNVAIGGTTKAAGGFTSITADALTVDTTTLVVDATNNRVGIGATSATARLEVTGAFGYASGANSLATTVSKAAARIRGSSDASTSLFFGSLTNDAQQYIQSSNGAGSAADDLALNPYGGAVGIGIANPTEKLTVVNSSSGVVGRFTNNTNQTLDLGVISGSGSAGGVYYNAANSGHHRFQVGGNTKLKIVGDNVGIGRDPRVMLDVAGEVAIAHNATYGLRFYNQPQNNWSSIGNPETSSSATLVFKAASGEGMRLDGNSNLLVGKTTTAIATAGTFIGVGGNVGLVEITRNGSPPLRLNRTSDFGQIIRLDKDGVIHGRLGTGGSYFYLAGGAAGGTHSGIRFINSGSARPCTATGGNLDNTVSLGASASRWTQVFAVSSTINTSDRNEKQDIEELSDAEQRVAVAAKGLLRKYRWRDAVLAKGDDARIHFGIIAQDLQDAFAAEGLDAARYGMWCSDTVWVDSEGEDYATQEEAPEGATEQTRLGVRYAQLLAFIISAI